MESGQKKAKKYAKIISALMIIAVAGPTVTAATLVSNWTFDSDLTDAVGGKDATKFGDANFQTTTSQIGAGAAIFDGTGDYMTAGTTNDFVIGTGTMSVSFWFKVTTAGSSDRFLSTGASALNTQSGWTVFQDTNLDMIGPGMSDGTGRTIQKGNANGAVSPFDGNWHLSVTVFDATTGTVNNYVDSVLETTRAPELLPDPPGTGATGAVGNSYILNFGSNNGIWELHGYLDDVAIWDGSLSQSDVDLLWNNGSGTSAAAAAVPEPSTLALLGMAGLIIWLYRFRLFHAA